MNKKTPNKHAEDETLNFEDKVLTLLSSLSHSLETFQDTTEDMQRQIKDFRALIHSEEID
tara:strand:+ start:1371 stop:1550 length:180 start_codon:yes stop_codon:yes gene_type:complete